MTDSEMFDFLGAEATPENLREWLEGKSIDEIEAEMRVCWPQDDNRDLAEKVFEYLN